MDKDTIVNPITSVMWTVKKASDIRELAVIAQTLEESGWDIKVTSVDELTILASKPSVERIDG